MTIWPYFGVKLSCVFLIFAQNKKRKEKRMYYSDPKVTYSHPKVTSAILKMTESNLKVTYSGPMVNYSYHNVTHR